jgi:hypothetical protein
LAVGELYVQTLRVERDGRLELLSFDAEQDCWRHYADRFGGRLTIKPNAYVRLGLGAYEDRYFVEADLGTEGRSGIARKLRANIAYCQSGVEQARDEMFPHVLLAANSEERRAAVAGVASRLPAET